VADQAAGEDDRFVRVRGARVHNLRDVNLDVPRNAIVVFTGVSGSGKSSLAFGTIFAEAQRRYLEVLAPHARRLINQVAAPDVDQITGLPPAVALPQQRGPNTSTRSTVGSFSTLSNTLRLLYSRAGLYPEGASPLDSDAFSPNTHAGACIHCAGLGRTYRATEESLVPDPSLTIREKAIAAWPGAWHGKNLRDILDALGYDVDRPWRELPQTDRDWILFTDDQPVVTVTPVRDATTVQGPYQGTYTSARRYVLHTIATTNSPALRRRALRHVVTVDCPACAGRRLRAESLAVTICGLAIDQLTARPLDDLARFLTRSGVESPVAKRMLDDIAASIQTLTSLGLGHLSLNRLTTTLSSGEFQRLRLATAVRGELFGVVYVLDEPTAGLHPADTTAVIGVLERLRRDGNSIFVVEHNMSVVRQADWLVDVGPAAGAGGGRVLHSGPVGDLATVEESVTRAFLSAAPAPGNSSPRTPHGHLELRGMSRHNLRNLDIDLPLGLLVALTGVSGAGKSSLLQQTAEVAARMGHRVVWLDHQPIGRTPRSNLATYTGVFDRIRSLFASTDAARRRGYNASRFSFNRPAGRCPGCEGDGYTSVELLFLPSLYVQCPTCHGTRYNPETLQITWQDATIADVLALTVEQATEFFTDTPSIHPALETIQDIGLGYITLGQPATQLSGGEAQRLKLAAELARTRPQQPSTSPRALYLLDDPTTGLHPADVALLARHLHELVDAGHTVLATSHDLTIITGADRIIELGPGAGHHGGAIVAAGTPFDLAADPTNLTGKYLRTISRLPGSFRVDRSE
jgi:excinuclease ABC subunit A